MMDLQVSKWVQQFLLVPYFTKDLSKWLMIKSTVEHQVLEMKKIYQQWEVVIQLEKDNLMQEGH